MAGVQARAIASVLPRTITASGPGTPVSVTPLSLNAGSVFACGLAASLTITDGTGIAQNVTITGTGTSN